MALKKPSDFFGIDKVSDLTEQVEKITQDSSEPELESKISSSFSAIDGVFKDIQEQLQESSKKQIGEIKEEVVRLYEVVDNIIENEIPKYKKQFGTTELRVESRISDLRKELCEHLETQVKQTKTKIEELYKETLDHEISSARSFIKSLYQSEIQIAVEKYVSTYSQEIVSLREEVFNELKKRPTTFTNIESKLQDLTHKYRLLSEGLLDQPKKQQDDPITQQSAITIEQLNKHYQILVSRLQEKLATVGGGGEVRLRYLDDVVGIKTNPSAYNGKFLKYDHTIGQFVFEAVAGTGGVADYAGVSGFSTYAGNVGFATFAGVSGFATVATRAGIATYSSIAGFATVSIQSGVSTIASVAGFATNATRAGLATFSTSAATAGFSTVASIAGFSTVAAVAGFATNATRAGVATFSSLSGSAGFSTVASIAGFATYAGNVGFATFSGVAGFATVAGRAGLATLTPYSYAAGFSTVSTVSGVATFATVSGVSGFATVSTQAGIATNVVGGVASVSSLNVTGLSTFAGVTTYTAPLFGTDASFTGIVTASVFVGSGVNLTGLTGALPNTYGNATAVPQIIVDGNGRITSISNVTISAGGGGGTGINVRNLGSVVGFAGTIDFGTGLSASTISQGISTVTVGFNTYSAVAGFATVSTQAGVSTLSTYSYSAGFSTVASVAGFSSVSSIAGFATYAGNVGFATFSAVAGFATVSSTAGFATVSTQAGISTSVIGGVASINSLNVSGVSTLGLVTAGNIFSTGVITATTFNGNHLGTGTNLTGIVTSLVAGTNVTLSGSTGQVTINASAGGIVGIATTTTSFFNQINATGVVTASSFSGSASNLTGLTGASANTYGNATAVPQIIVDANGRITSISNVAITGGGGGGGGTGIFVNNGSLVGFAGTVDFAASGISVSPLSAGIVTATVIAAPNAGFATFARWAGISTISSISGFATVASVAGFATVASVAGFSTNATRAGVATFADTSGVAGFATYAGNVGFATFSGISGFATVATQAGVSTVASVAGFATASAVAGFATVSTQAGVSSSVVSGVGSIVQLQVTGISTFSNGPVFIGSATSTGTPSQKLQVIGGVYISSNLGIGTINPTQPFQVGSGSTIVVVDGAGDLGIGTTNPVSKLQVDRYGVSTGFGTFVATAGIATDIDTFTISATDFKTAEYTLHFIQLGNIQAQKVLVMQNGTTAYSQEYGVMSEPNLILGVGATISAGLCRLQVTPETGITGIVTYRFTRQTML